MIFKNFFTCKSFNSLEFILEWETDEDFLAPRELIFIILFNIFFSVIWHAIFINIRCQWPYFIVVCEKAKQVYKSLAYRKYLFKFLNPYYVRLCREKHGTYKTLESKKKKKSTSSFWIYVFTQWLGAGVEGREILWFHEATERT